MPIFFSIVAWAIEPRMSWRHSRQSNEMDSVNRTTSASGPPANRLLRETGYDRVTLAEIQGMPDAATGERLMRYYKALWTELTRA